MKIQELKDTARRMVAHDKGLLAMDESNPTCNKRFAKQGIPQTEEARRAYRELLITTPHLGECVSGVILYDETIRESEKTALRLLRLSRMRELFLVSKWTLARRTSRVIPGEKVTEGLDGLRERLKQNFQMGARFAKWRAVITPGSAGPSRGIPSRGCIEANAGALARYAALCQEAGLVPVVEPEVLMEGDHTLKRCSELTEEVLRAVFTHLYLQWVD
jgi:fructose-bisphosphate aldolase class I